MFGMLIKNTQNIQDNKQILQNIICFPLYDRFTTSMFFEKQLYREDQ